MPDSPVLIIGDDPVNALGVARNLGRFGIPVYRLGSGESKILRSRFIKSTRIFCELDECADEIYVDQLAQIADYIGEKAVLFPLSDIHVLRVSSNAAALSKHYNHAFPDLGVVETLVNKRRSYESLEAFGVPHPRSRYPASDEEFLQAAEEIGYPVFLKPEISPLFARLFKLKGLVAEDPQELRSQVERLRGTKLDVVLQEIIPGDATCMHGCAGLITDEELLTFCYRRVREFPSGFGCGSLLESTADFSNQTPLVNYLRHIGYRGIFDAEFKLDPRDGIYKVIEINARSWWQNLLPTASGINLVKAAYDHALGRRVDSMSYQQNVKWMHLYNDFYAGREAGMGLASWLRSLHSVRSFDIWASDDVRPMVAFLSEIIARKTRKIFGVKK